MEPQKVWNKSLDIIKGQISAGNFRTWFSQADIRTIENNVMIIIVPSAFIKGQLSARYEQLIIAAVEQVYGQEIRLQFEIDASRAQKKSTEQQQESDFFQFSSRQDNRLTTNLNPKYTLKNFVVGLTNNLAYAAAQAVVQNPGMSYNPLFIYGPSGVGKTHLMQGIGNELLQKNHSTKLIYASSERFMNDFVDSIQNKKMGEFRTRYRSCDILLIDDIQFISGKDSMQEEFFHTFNELQGKNAQIVLTSDRPPNEIQKLENRLASRFQGGLMVDVQLPDFDTRVAILRAKLDEKQETLPDECVTYIAETFPSNTRELEGKLISIIQMVKLMHLEPNLETVQRVLGKPKISSNTNLDHKKVLGGINQYFNIKMHDLTGPRRQKELVLPRQIAMFIMYEDCKLPMEKIGEILGGRDHTTVLHGIEKIREAKNRDRELQKILIELKQQILA